MTLNITKRTEYEVQCAQCEKTETICSGAPYYLVAATPEGYFRRRGWNVKNGKTVCRECFGKEKK